MNLRLVIVTSRSYDKSKVSSPSTESAAVPLKAPLDQEPGITAAAGGSNQKEQVV